MQTNGLGTRWLALVAIMVSFCAMATSCGTETETRAAGLALGELPRPVVRERLVDPRTHPEYTRRGFAAPTWDTFDHRPQLVGGRYHGANWDIAAADLARIVPAGEPMDGRPWFVGRVYRPDLGMMHARDEDFHAGIERMHREGMFLFNIGGYGPGSPWKGSFGQAKIPSSRLEDLRRTLGDRFLGFDLGEQDGRYHNVFEKVQLPSPRDDIGQHRLFHDWCDRVIDDQGGRLSMLTVLWNWHHPVRDGAMTLIGAECQNKHGVTNAQVQYAFLRGAGRQYGVLWFGDVSVFSTFGLSGWHLDDDGALVAEPGGNSANLMRRLFLSQWLWNCCILGFEGKTVAAVPDEKRASSRVPNRPSPIGMVQMGVEKMLQDGFTPGVMQSPVAILLDGLSGWMPPRTNRVQFRTWNDLPYTAGDHFVDNVLSLLYPGYEDCGWYMDERGCLSATPHGDIADCLLGDASAETLSQYGLVICGGITHDAAGVRERLEQFTANGGTVIAIGDDAARLWPEWFSDRRVTVPTDAVIRWTHDGTETAEADAFVMRDLRVPPAGEVLATCDGLPAVVRVPTQRGAIIVLCAATGSPRDARPFKPGGHPMWGGENTGLERPFPLLRHVDAAVDRALASQRLFTAGAGLAVTTCRRDARTFTVGLMNPGLKRLPFTLVSHIGPIASIREVAIDPAIHELPGYWPHAWGPYAPQAAPNRKDLGELRGESAAGDPGQIGGGDMRLFTVVLDSCTARPVPAVASAVAPDGRLLALPDLVTLRKRLLGWPSFARVFDGVAVDWRAVRDADADWLRTLGRWLERHGIRLLVDGRDAPSEMVTQVAASLGGMRGRRDLVLDRTEDPLVAQCAAAGITIKRPGDIVWRTAAEEPSVAARAGMQVLLSDWNSWDVIARDARAAWRSGGMDVIRGRRPSHEAVTSSASDGIARLLAVHDAAGPEDAVAARPGFFTAFNGLMLDVDWLLSRSDTAIDRDRQWLQTSRTHVIIDFTRSINGFPDLTFSPSVPHRHAESSRLLATAIAKMARLGARQAVITSHMRSETVDDWDMQREGIERFLAAAAKAGITVHWRPHRHRPPGTLSQHAALVAELRLAHPNLRLAGCTVEEPVVAQFAETTRAAGAPEVWLLATPAGPECKGTRFLPLASLLPAQRAEVVRATSDSAVVMDADYASWEEVLADVKALQQDASP